MNDFDVPDPQIQELANELSAFNGLPTERVRALLETELGRLGGRIAEEWRSQRPLTTQQIEQFYKETDAYLYELLIDGENPFRGLIRGVIFETLRKRKVHSVFEFGGGIGTDAMWFAQQGLQWTYFDLPEGKTFQFASWRFARNKLPVAVVTSPTQSNANDAAISLEVFEHLPNLLAALRAINQTLRPDGLLIFTESFGKTERHPLHLTRTAIQGRFLNEIVQAAGFEPVRRFGPEDCLYRTVKRREPKSYDLAVVVWLIMKRVIRKVPSRIARLFSKQPSRLS